MGLQLCIQRSLHGQGKTLHVGDRGVYVNIVKMGASPNTCGGEVSFDSRPHHQSASFLVSCTRAYHTVKYLHMILRQPRKIFLRSILHMILRQPRKIAAKMKVSHRNLTQKLHADISGP